MNRQILSAIALYLTFVCAPTSSWGDAASDLADGQAALGRGELDKAAGLLTTASQGLPQSVEAQLALAECQLKLGDFEKANE